MVYGLTVVMRQETLFFRFSKEMHNFPVMNSIFNEQPTRKITSEFVEKAVGDATITYTNPGTVQQTSSGVGAFRFMLESNIGKVKN